MFLPAIAAALAVTKPWDKFRPKPPSGGTGANAGARPPAAPAKPGGIIKLPNLVAGIGSSVANATSQAAQNAMQKQRQAPPGGNATIQVTNYPTAPVGPTAAQMMMWDQALLDATEKAALAQAQASSGTNTANMDRLMAVQNIVRGAGQARTDARAAAGSAGLALSPATMGRMARQIRDEQAAGMSSAERARATTIQALLNAVALANQNYDRVLANINQQRAVYGADVNALLPGVRF